MKKLIYVAGPYTNPDPVINTRRSIELGMRLHDSGAIAIVPHITMFVYFLFPRPLEFWYEYGMGILEHCDYVYRFSGKSTGADAEVARAADLGIPVYFEDDGVTPESLCEVLGIDRRGTHGV